MDVRVSRVTYASETEASTSPGTISSPNGASAETDGEMTFHSHAEQELRPADR